MHSLLQQPLARVMHDVEHVHCEFQTVKPETQLLSAKVNPCQN